MISAWCAFTLCPADELVRAKCDAACQMVSDIRAVSAGRIVMAKFITRVELSNAAEADYALLDRVMRKEGFSNKIKADDGSAFQLPSGTYYSYGGISVLDVRAYANRAAAKTGKAYWIFVCDYTLSAWQLKPV